ncbi:MAG TPA: glycosyltransferase [Conexibacter sp.]|nr:glycosyltransferase [Conexibacter sp.]
MRLGAVGQDGANAYYRLVLPLMAMRERGHEIVHVVQEYKRVIDVRPLLGCDVVHIHRPALLYDDGDVVTRLLEAGVTVGFDEDDNVIDMPEGLEEKTDQPWMPRARRNFELLLEHVGRVQLVTTPSDHLADRFEAAGARNVHVIDNYLPGAFNRVEPEGHDGVVIGWHAGREHLVDAESLGLVPTLERLLDAHPDLRVVTINIDLTRVGMRHERYACEEPTPIEALTQRLADFDVGIVPLADIPFNRGRSNVKAREYAAAGVPWLASPVGSYEQLGDDEGGRLVADDGWFEALDELVRSRRARAKQGKRAKAWAKRETIWNMAEAWERLFLDALAAARAAA